MFLAGSLEGKTCICFSVITQYEYILERTAFLEYRETAVQIQLMSLYVGSNNSFGNTARQILFMDIACLLKHCGLSCYVL